MEQRQFERLFVSREACAVYRLAEEDCGNGWIGGNAPGYFDDKPDMVNNGDEAYYFYMAFVNPLNGKMLSVFLPDFEIYNERADYPDCAIKVVEHEPSAESEKGSYRMFQEEPPEEKKNEYQKKFDYTIPVINKAYFAKMELRDESQARESFLQLGGHPFLIQGDRTHDALEAAGYGFLFSVTEAGYPDGLIHGNDPFCDGAAYFYAKIADAPGMVEGVTAGFWQCG